MGVSLYAESKGTAGFFLSLDYSLCQYLWYFLLVTGDRVGVCAIRREILDGDKARCISFEVDMKWGLSL